jgi:adenylosuccinate lyase
MTNVFDNLAVYPENMKKNLDSSKGLIMGESVMIALTKKGVGRQKGHEIVRQAAMKAVAEDLIFKDVLAEDETVSQTLTKGELEDALNPEKYTGKAQEIVENIIKKYGE